MILRGACVVVLQEGDRPLRPPAQHARRLAPGILQPPVFLTLDCLLAQTRHLLTSDNAAGLPQQSSRTCRTALVVKSKAAAAPSSASTQSTICCRCLSCAAGSCGPQQPLQRAKLPRHALHLIVIQQAALVLAVQPNLTYGQLWLGDSNVLLHPAAAGDTHSARAALELQGVQSLGSHHEAA